MQTDVILVVSTIDLLLTVESTEIELHFLDHPGRTMKITKSKDHMPLSLASNAYTAINLPAIS